MVLSKKSWHFFIHRLAWGDERKEPTNLCPYFWKTIVFGTIFSLVLLPLALPLMITRAIWLMFDEYDAPPDVFDKGLISEYSVMTIVYDFVLCIVYSMFAMWFFAFPRNEKGEAEILAVHVLGGLGWIIILIVGIYFLNEYRKDRRREKRYRQAAGGGVEVKESSPNVIIEAIKSWYKRNCPMIKWK